jgi:hypothetical protein
VGKVRAQWVLSVGHTINDGSEDIINSAEVHFSHAPEWTKWFLDPDPVDIVQVVYRAWNQRTSTDRGH